MKYAIVEGQRQEAQPGGSGTCPACDSPVIAKCGAVRDHHWAHRGMHCGDAWWESETQWHRDWKDKFPRDWQEIVHPAENNERHIADMKTNQGWALEFQHSKINPNERNTREAFYKKLVWVVDGTRRKRDQPQFIKALKDRMPCVKGLNLFKIPFPEECALLRDWTGSNAPVFFDFSRCGKSEDRYLWCLVRVVNGMAYVGPFSRSHFIKYHSPEAMMNKLDFSEWWKNINEAVDIISKPREDRYFGPPPAMLRRQKRFRRM